MIDLDMLDQLAKEMPTAPVVRGIRETFHHVHGYIPLYTLCYSGPVPYEFGSFKTREEADYHAAIAPKVLLALTARLREQGTMLRRLEWAVDWSRFGIASNHCPVCGNERSHGHAPDCELAALLAALPGAAGTTEEG
jgi:hypothetical protein